MHAQLLVGWPMVLEDVSPRREGGEEGVRVPARAEILEQLGRHRAPREVLGELHLVQEEVEDVPVAGVVRDRAAAVRRSDRILLGGPVWNLERLEAFLRAQCEELVTDRLKVPVHPRMRGRRGLFLVEY